VQCERDSDEEIEITVDVEDDSVEVERGDLVALNRQGKVVVAALQPPDERSDPTYRLFRARALPTTRKRSSASSQTAASRSASASAPERSISRWECDPIEPRIAAVWGDNK